MSVIVMENKWDGCTSVSHVASYNEGQFKWSRQESDDLD